MRGFFHGGGNVTTLLKFSFGASPLEQNTVLTWAATQGGDLGGAPRVGLR